MFQIGITCVRFSAQDRMWMHMHSVGVFFLNNNQRNLKEHSEKTISPKNVVVLSLDFHTMFGGSYK